MMTEPKRDEICYKIFKMLVDEPGCDGADMIIILKRTLMSTVTSLSRADGIDKEMINRTYETLAHEFLTMAMNTFADKQEMTINNN